MKNPPRKPTALRALEGGRSHSLRKPVFVDEPKPRPAMPRCPAHLDAQARQTWNKLAPTLARLNLLTEIDGAAFAVLCQLQARLVYLARTLKQREHKSLLDGDRPSAYVMMERQYYQLFRQFAAEFGLTPRGRVGLAVGGKDDDDELADLLD